MGNPRTIAAGIPRPSGRGGCQHEADFLRSLVKKGKPTDLSSLSFNASGITVRWLDLSGQHLMDTIEVAAFIDWAKTHNEALA